MKKSKNIYITFLFFWILIFIFFDYQYGQSGNGEQGAPFIRNYTPENYNAHSQNWAIVQDSRGVMYFGNRNGVLEFDGNSWKLIKVANNSTVRSLGIDSNGIIYVGANGEFGYLLSNPNGELAYKSLIDNLQEEEKNFKDVWDTHITTHGIYFVTSKRVYRYIDKKTDVLDIPSPSRFGYKVFDKIYIPLTDGGIVHLDNGKIQHLPHCEKLNSKTFGRILLLPFTDNTLLIISAKKGLYLYHTTGSSKNDFPTLLKFSTEVESFLQKFNLYSAVRVNADSFALGTLGGGIVIINKQGKIQQIINKNNGLQKNIATKIFVDNYGNLWASVNVGISYIEINSPLSKFGEVHGLEGIVLASRRYLGDIYVGTFNGVLYLQKDRDRLTDNIQKFIPVRNSSEQCFDLLLSNGVLYAGGNGVFQIRGTQAEKLINSKTIICFGTSKKFPNYIFAGLYPGFTAFKISQPGNNAGKVKLERMGVFEEIKDIIRKIISDDNGDLWLTTQYQGIIQIKFQGSNLKNYKIYRYTTEHGLPQLNTNIVCYINNRVVSCSEKGIHQAIKTSGNTKGGYEYRFVPENTYGKVFSDRSMGADLVYKDKKGNIWVTSEKVIGILSKGQDGKFQLFSNPFKKIQGQYASLFVEETGVAWISTTSGLFRYDPSIKNKWGSSYHTLIRRVTVNNKEILFGGTFFLPSSESDRQYTITSQTQPDHQIRILSHRENSIIFEFSAPYYEPGPDIKYQYILEGFDQAPSQWTTEIKKEYTNLHDGYYNFKVRAKNNSGFESSEASYIFSISPPWHQTLLANIMKFVLLMSVLFGAIWLNSKRLIASKRKLEEIVRQRTAQIKAQAEELKKLSIVASETDNAVVIMDAKANINWVNEGFTRIYGFTLEQLKKERGENLMEISTNPDIKDLINSCIHEHKTTVYDSLINTRQGEKKWAQTTLTPVLLENGDISKIVVIESDITKVKEAEEAAERANQSKSEFLARMSHEIRTPMNGVIGFTDMLLDTKLSEEQIDYARTISRSGEALITLLNDILDFSKIEAGELTFDAIDFDPEITAFDICEIIMPRIGTKPVEILCRIGDDVPSYIKTDPGRFRQVIINLMGNAAKFTEQGEIELSLNIAEENADKLKMHVKVRDTGIGIPEDKLDTVFEVFQQADGSTTRKYGGTGLGLSICKQIANLMEGDVWVESELGKGSEFHFTSWVEKSSKKSEKKVTTLKGRRALILDDNKTNLEILSHVLELNHMEVEKLGNPKKVIPLILDKYKRNERLDIAIIDIQMPELSGYELANKIRNLDSPMCDLVLLAFSSSTVNRSKKFRDSGFNGFLPKPINRKKLTKMIERLLGLQTEDSVTKKTEMITQHTIIEESKHSVQILLAEDNPINQKLASFMLNKAGYKLTIVNNGEEAVNAVSNDPSKYDLVLMDVQMPVLNGKEATKIIREKGFIDIPIIAMTAEAMKGDREKCIEAGMNDYIPKPMKRDVVFKIVKKWCLEK